jgi:flagellar hook assembly protein FlgD
MNGRIIRIFRTTVPSSGYQLSSVEWDGNDSNGRKAGRGMYPYTVSVTTSSGETASVSGRLIIY